MQMKITMITLLYTYVKVLRMKQLMAIYKVKNQRIIHLKLMIIMMMKLIYYHQQMLISEWHPSYYDYISLE